MADSKPFGYTYVTTIQTSKGELYYCGKKHRSEFDPTYLGSGAVVKRLIARRGTASMTVKYVNFYETLDELNEAEIALIDRYKKLHGRRCVNRLAGGEGFTPSEAKAIRSRKSVYRVTSEYTKRLWKSDDYVHRVTIARNKAMRSEQYKNSMSAATSLGKNGRAKKVICLDTGKVYSCAKEAEIELGVDTVASACHSGYRANGHRFMYLEKFNSFVESERKLLLVDRRGQRQVGCRARKVICIESGEVFTSISRAIEWCGGDVYQALIKNMRAGGYRWMYYDDWVKTQEQAAAA